jgi:hypothetical protein
MKLTYITLKYATIAFAVIGLICGGLANHTLAVSYCCLGLMLGALLSVVAAVMCMFVNRINKLNTISLVLNVILFVVIAREFQIL